MNRALDEAIDRACRPDSLYMSFLNADERVEVREVEIRIDVSERKIADLTAYASAAGWHVQPRGRAPQGAVLLRRAQDLRDATLFALFREALTLAHNHDGRFHSWLHEPDMDSNA